MAGPIAFPTVHINGSSAESLMDGFETAIEALRRAIECVGDTAPHARDYYIQDPGEFERAKQQHAARIEALRLVRIELEAIRASVETQDQGRRSQRPFGNHVDQITQPFCACGHVVSRCDGSRRGCQRAGR